jgi:hypothetical protein
MIVLDRDSMSRTRGFIHGDILQTADGFNYGQETAIGHRVELSRTRSILFAMETSLFTFRPFFLCADS